MEALKKSWNAVNYFLFPSQIIAVNKGDTMGLLMRRTEDEEALYSVIFSVTLFKDSDS